MKPFAKYFFARKYFERAYLREAIENYVPYDKYIMGVFCNFISMDRDAHDYVARMNDESKMSLIRANESNAEMAYEWYEAGTFVESFETYVEYIIYWNMNKCIEQYYTEALNIYRESGDFEASIVEINKIPEIISI